MKAALEIELTRPYKRSVDFLLKFCVLWRCRVEKVGTHERLARIVIDGNAFKTIWGKTPKKGAVEVPNGMEFFVKSVRVVEVRKASV